MALGALYDASLEKMWKSWKMLLKEKRSCRRVCVMKSGGTVDACST